MQRKNSNWNDPVIAILFLLIIGIISLVMGMAVKHGLLNYKTTKQTKTEITSQQQIEKKKEVPKLSSSKKKIEETLPYSRYAWCRKIKSKIDIYYTSANSECFFRCPKCEKTLKDLKHGEKITCPGCNMHMQRFGNALECTVK